MLKKGGKKTNKKKNKRETFWFTSLNGLHTLICGLDREQANWGAETVQEEKELREPELSDTREQINEQRKEEMVISLLHRVTINQIIV